MEKTSDPNVEVSDLIEAINYEELMGEKGYESGDLADELDAAGWPRIPIKRTNDGDPIAFDAS